MSRFDEILERNRRYTAGRPAELPPRAAVFPIVIVTCVERTGESLRLPLGIDGGEALWFPTAGAFVAGDSSTMRTLMVALFLFDAREIVVVGHSACSFASFDTSRFIDAFRKRGIPRDAFGVDDLREWAGSGAVGNPRRGVELSVRNIMASAVRPRELPVSGAVLDDESASLSPVTVSNVPSVEPATERSASVGPVTVSAPASASASAPPRPPSESVEAVRKLLRESAKWSGEVSRLRDDLSRQHSAFAKLRLLTAFAKQVGAESHEMVDAFEILKSQIRPSSDPSVEAEQLVHLLEDLLARS